MFSLLRAALVIGAIFYFSPARHDSNTDTVTLANLLGAATQPFDTLKETATGSPQRLEAVWNALPDSARKAVVDRIVAAPADNRGEAKRPPQTDTLLPEDHRPAWTGTTKKPSS